MRSRQEIFVANLRENGSAPSPRDVGGSRSEEFETPTPMCLDGALCLGIDPAGPTATPGLTRGTTCEGDSEGQREGWQAHLRP